MGLHQERTHPTPVDGCFGCKVQEIDILGYVKPRESGWVSRDKQKAWDSECDNYRSAVKQGIEPDTTKRAGVELAKAISDKAGVGYGTPEFKQYSVNRALEKQV